MVYICKNVIMTYVTGTNPKIRFIMIPSIIHKSMRQLTALVAVLLSLACVFSCKKEKGGGDALEKIYFVDPASATMVITQGRSEQILYATVPEKAADTAILEWLSDDPSIADVINGLVTAVARAIP